jgi:hypothetical protein
MLEPVIQKVNEIKEIISEKVPEKIQETITDINIKKSIWCCCY